MQIHLLSSQSSVPQVRAEHPGHPRHLPDDLQAALGEQGHRVEIDRLGDTLHGYDLTSLREGATAGRKIAARLSGAHRVLHALDPVAWAAALTARSLADVSVVLRLNEPALGQDPVLRPSRPVSDLGAGRSSGSGRVSTIGAATERRAYRACLRSADAIAAARDGDRLAAVRAGVSTERTLIVPDVVSLPQPGTGALHPGRNILSISGIGPESGVETLLTALRWIPERELVLTGPGSAADAGEFRATLARLRLTHRVRWLGWVNRTDTVRLIEAAAVVVLPGRVTGGTSAIEAMARSRAVVTVAGGPAADVVVDGVTGLLLPADQPEALGRTLH